MSTSGVKVRCSCGRPDAPELNHGPLTCYVKPSAGVKGGEGQQHE